MDYRNLTRLIKVTADHPLVLEAKLEVKCKFWKWGIFPVHVISLTSVFCEVLQPEIRKNCWICFSAKRNVCGTTVEFDCSGQSCKIISCGYTRLSFQIVRGLHRNIFYMAAGAQSLVCLLEALTWLSSGL